MGGKEASEKKGGIGEDDRQPEMARLAARWRRFKLVILVTLRKGNHPGEAQMRKGPNKSFIQQREELHREAP